MSITSSAIVIRQPRQKLWKRLSCLQRFSFVYIPLSLIIIWSFLLYILLAPNKGNVQQTTLPLNDTCSTPGCIEASARLLKYMDQTIDPCDNFYKFACGGYLKNVYVDNDKEKSNIITQLNGRTEKQLREMFEQPITDNELRPFILLKQLYKNCMNVTKSNELDFVKVMFDDMGGWPILKGNEWNQNKFDWQKSIYKFRKYGLNINIFISVDVVDSPKDSSKKILHIDVANVEFGPRSLSNGFEDRLVQNYYDLLVTLATFFEADEKFAKSEVQNLMNFEINLAQIKNIENVEREYGTIKELQKNYPSIIWLDLINYAVFLPDKALKGDDLISITNLSYIQKLEALINKTTKRVLANHAIFQATISLLPYLRENFSSLAKKFNPNPDELEIQKPRWKECVTVTAESLKVVTGSLYVRKYFNTEDKLIVTELAESIKSEAIKNLLQIESQEEFLEKIRTMQMEVGYSDDVLDDDKIEDYYHDLKTTTDSYLLFMGNLSLFNTDKKFRKLFESTSNIDLLETISPIEISITYSAQKNNLQIPAAILQEGLFNTKQFNSINYGGIGSFIAQALMQTIVNITGFDLTKEQEIRCLFDQFPNLTFLNFDSNDNNILYPLGLKYALWAYQTIHAQNKVSQLPGLNYTSQQLFWISAANFQCEKLRGSLNTPNETPNSISALISNFKTFEKDFNCMKENNVNSVKNGICKYNL